MARWTPVDGWSGATRYVAPSGRQFIAAPRGLVPHFPYLMDSLRPPRPDEQAALGGESRLVLDVSEVLHLDQIIARRGLYCAPWNTYLVVRQTNGDVAVVHLVRTGLRRLLLPDATTVSIAAGYDVAGWPAEVERGRWLDQWTFSHPHGHSLTEQPPTPGYLALSGSGHR